MKVKLSLIATILAFGLIGYLAYLKFILEQEVDTRILFAAAICALAGSILRRNGK